MCGFLYARHHFPNNDFSDYFNAALKLMHYRGKDALGVYEIDGHYFGHVRLSILDLSDRSNQPVVSNNNVLLFKGEAYNYKNLVSDAVSDTLAINKLVQDKVDISNKLAGMYAVLTYDKRNGMVRVIRDFYGEKPLYYYQDDTITVISSTIKSIVYLVNHVSHKQLTINQMAIYDYLACGYIREPKSIYNDIQQLSSGHELFLSKEGIISIINHAATILQTAHADKNAHIANCIKNTDVEGGILLSSGVDSTYLLSHLDGANVDFRVITYKANHARLNEATDAIKNVKKIVRSKQVPIDIVENHTNIVDLYTQYPRILEQPSSDGMNLFNILSVSRNKNEFLKLIFLGTGGDELYGGYHSFKNYKKVALIRALSFAHRFIPAKYQRFFSFLNDKQNKVESYYYFYRFCPTFFEIFPQVVIEKMFNEFVSEMKKYTQQTALASQQKIKFYETLDYMRNQLLRDADNISLACGYEARNPLLSIDAFKFEPDNKQALKNELLKKHNIKFNKKRGFTLYSVEEQLREFISNEINKLNTEYKLFTEKTFQFITEKGNFSIQKKIYTLLAWLKANHVHQKQLQGFRI